MMQTITIANLACNAPIGVYEAELSKTQPLVLHLRLQIDATAAIESDALCDTLDYDALCQHLVHFVETHRFGLLEKLLAALIDELANFSAVTKAHVSIDKPQALSAYGAMASLSASWQRHA